MNRKQNWATAVVRNSKPITYTYTTKGGIQGTTDKVLLFCPQFDFFNRCSSAALGSGNGYANYSAITTPTQWASSVEESPQLMFAWALYNSLDDSTEQRRKYLWGPRTYRWEFTNQELFPMQLSIFWVRPRRDIDYSNVAFSASLGDWNVGSDVNDIIYRCFVRDRIFTDPTPTGLSTSLTMSFSPFQSTSFCQLFKVVKVNKFKLDSGKCVNITHKLKKYRSISDLAFADINYVCTRKTLIPIIMCQGCPVYDSADVKKVAGGACALTWITKINFNWWTMNANTQQYIITDLVAPAGLITPANAVYVSKPAAVVVSAAP